MDHCGRPRANDTHWIPPDHYNNIRGTADRDMARSTQDLILRDARVYDFASGELIRGDSEGAVDMRHSQIWFQMVGSRHVPPRPTGAPAGALYDIGQRFDIGNSPCRAF